MRPSPSLVAAAAVCARRLRGRRLGSSCERSRSASLVVGLLLLAVRRFAGDYLVDQLAQDDAVKPAAHDAWDILTQVLADRAWVWIILGVITLRRSLVRRADRPRCAGAPRRGPRPSRAAPTTLRDRRGCRRSHSSSSLRRSPRGWLVGASSWSRSSSPASRSSAPWFFGKRHSPSRRHRVSDAA